MAGHGATKVDPAIERFSRMREDVYMHFRWTPRTTRAAFLGVVLIPAALYYSIAAGELKWNFSAKRKGEPLAER